MRGRVKRKEIPIKEEKTTSEKKIEKLERSAETKQRIKRIEKLERSAEMKRRIKRNEIPIT